MSNLSANIIHLKKAPNNRLLLLKAAFKKSQKIDRDFHAQLMPDEQFHLESIRLEESRIRPFHSVVHWQPQIKFVHPCYLHTLAFPLHLRLLLLPSCPFALLGLIHLSNQINQIRPIVANEKLHMMASFGRLSKHAKGWTFSINIEFYNSGELVWSSQSRYLSRSKQSQTPSSQKGRPEKGNNGQISIEQALSNKLGIEYAKVSGDYNPIHLTKLSAQLFGLKRHIAHGMWTKAFSLSMLQSSPETKLNNAFETNVEFKQPLYLPNKISCLIQKQQAASAEQSAFKVQSILNTKIYQHLLGNIRFI